MTENGGQDIATRVSVPSFSVPGCKDLVRWQWRALIGQSLDLACAWPNGKAYSRNHALPVDHMHRVAAYYYL